MPVQRWGAGRAKRWNASKENDMAQPGGCSHLKQIKLTHPTVHVCKECVERGDTWVHLRMCLECGHVGCCDSSKNKHATGHFRAIKHPLIRSIEPGEAWVWCYVDELMATELRD
jgi:uncharacterized UBP type Zn finger protein